MKVVMIGAGYVGLVSGSCFAEFGANVTCVDLDQAKIDRLKAGGIPIYEPGLEDLVARNVAAGRLAFTTDLAGAVSEADLVFIAVGTPTRRGDGHADLAYVYAAAEDIAKNLQGYTVIVDKSTVPVGTARQVERIVREANPQADFDVASNPEFLREGAAISDFMRPDRVVLGVESERAEALLRDLYRPLNLIEAPILVTNLESAELIKYASNAFLATKISFINEMSQLCEAVGADVHAIAKGMGLDGRIGKKFLHAGPGYGGSCFPKDTLALVRIAQEHGVASRIVESVVEVNASQKAQMVKKIRSALGGSESGKTIAVLGLTFKPETDDMRDAPALSILPPLCDKGAKIQAHDPQGMAEAKHMLPASVQYFDSAYAAIAGADAVVLMTEWNEYRGLSANKIKELMAGKVFVDLRNVYEPAAMRAAGFEYCGVGR
ncbi:UDP-glucose/GDP-mannose dehydrogenase family protein [Dasania sp. GY-MA-18]|uniref:UDP-glucose 6-dehydrogenase n=1 Tax=Dasania phycosphaerae TaxID=2950436 RepID=A0A9J6RPF1_9GAMM|nr:MULTISPECIES: UDP-glucose/GDP-mannose dehydrogenase family protein [Dasania]MCR8923751.1 UDP-glucose/GDP-mannose dehydrogenase family protein [Dasania sp. GY-MA-18]MCZ0866185.1 UDP-glucose/GDP-mannose dehydrogenase family protein [Dasania phycosphaerae]MCZ0869909.1 UDP-glucose/GDP-mannose dehydrogenase family protein [Dasania phycosphaerae]